MTSIIYWKAPVQFKMNGNCLACHAAQIGIFNHECEMISNDSNCPSAVSVETRRNEKLARNKNRSNAFKLISYLLDNMTS